ncbi:MAG: hypothetical protein JNL75_09000 [Chitinophagales bacterium]|nr:hypothetical protein [Chitinophagales bacterium]
MIGPNTFFVNRTVVIATMHGKETVIAPLLEKRLGVKLRLVDNMDTDILGTFTGEVERKDSPIDTLRKKCQMALEITGLDLAVASEGSFGAHPSAFFAHANDELVMLLDTKNNLEIVARELTTDTNFNGAIIESENQLVDFATKALFPSHKLILRNGENKKDKIIKGIGDWEELKAQYHKLLEEYDKVYAETDMRAMHNPTRMRVIAKATSNLIDKLNSLCPQCQTPGYTVTKVIQGLPCGLCEQPTASTLSHILSCSLCRHNETILYPNNKKTEDPMYCDFCNP